MYTNIHMYIFTYVYVYVYIYVCIYAYVHMCVCVCVCVCVCARYICIYRKVPNGAPPFLKILDNSFAPLHYFGRKK